MKYTKLNERHSLINNKGSTNQIYVHIPLLTHTEKHDAYQRTLKGNTNYKCTHSIAHTEKHDVYINGHSN